MKETFDSFSAEVFKIFDKDWAILVSGDERPNPMTISWGGLGTLYSKPVATVYVRPTRFSFGFMMEHNEFTVNFLPSNMKNIYDICGSMSGKNCDKWVEAKIHKAKSSIIKTPYIKEAKLAFECRTIVRVPLKRESFLSEEIFYFYEMEDYHTIFIGEVLKIHKS